MKTPSFGILDFGTRQPELNSLLKLEDVIHSAVMAEKLGYDRYWISEHHFSQKSLAWSNPQAVLPLLAGATRHIRIGVAGVLLNLYSPYHLATFYKLLNNVYGQRIDLGLANGRPGNQTFRYATGSENPEAGGTFDEKLEKLVYLLREDESIFENGEGVVIPPYKGVAPQIWSLSSSAYRTAGRVVKLQLNLSRSLFHQMAEQGYAREQLAQLREECFKEHGTLPKVNLVLGIVCHKTMQQARRLVSHISEESPYLNLVGCPNFFYDRIQEYQENYDIDEFILYNYAVHTKDRYTAMRLISKVFDLSSKTLVEA